MSNFKIIKIVSPHICIIEYFISLLLILSANSIYLYDDIELHINIIIGIALLVYLIVLFIKKDITIRKIKDFFIKYNKYFFLYYLYIICFILLNKAYSRTFISQFIIILPVLTILFLIHSKKRELLLEKMLKIIVVIASMSLIFYILLDVLKIIPYTNTIHINWGIDRYVPSFLGLHFNTQTTHLAGLTLSRNTGIFTEAPMFSLVLVLILAYYEFISKMKKINIIRIILLITIITTFSITGYISALIIYTLKLTKSFYPKIKNMKKIQKLFFLLLSILSIFCCMFLISYKLNTGSGSMRIDDYQACYKTWINHSVLLGAGFDNEEAIKENMSDFRSNDQGLSNSIMVILAEGGIMLFAIYIIPFILLLIIAFRKKSINIICFEVIILFLFCTTIFCYQAIMMNILANGYSLILKNKQKRKVL